jgi:ADP-ribose pyrophosphatase YjhB (NUDIX family)
MEILYPVVVCSALVEKAGKFLMVFCPKFKKWRVPGGKVENDEALEETLKREMQEEIGIEIVNPQFLGWGQDADLNHISGKKIPRLLMFFHVKTDKELTINPEEAEDYKWVTIDEMKSQDKEGALQDFWERFAGTPEGIFHH